LWWAYKNVMNSNISISLLIYHWNVGPQGGRTRVSSCLCRRKFNSNLSHRWVRPNVSIRLHRAAEEDATDALVRSNQFKRAWMISVGSLLTGRKIAHLDSSAAFRGTDNIWYSARRGDRQNTGDRWSSKTMRGLASVFKVFPIVYIGKFCTFFWILSLSTHCWTSLYYTCPGC
jgi:hypothetical protein